MPIKSVLLSLLIWIPGIVSAAANSLEAVASIKPVHSLVAGVMRGVGEPSLLLKGGVSPHDYSLRPSDVRLLDNARVVFWIGKNLESFLVKPLENSKARSVALQEVPDMELLTLREGGIWNSHTHHHGDKKGNHDHAEKDNDHEPAGHEHGDYDAHIWLSPRNAIAMVRQIAIVLSEIDPEHETIYQSNAEAMTKRLEALDAQLAATLAAVKDRPYIVFHDAYQYFERRYNLAAAGSITVSPEQRPGTRRLQEIRERITANKVVCVFSEPQFKPALVNTLIENTAARSGVLDPLGTDLDEGPDAYFQLLTNLASALRNCLIGASQR